MKKENSKKIRAQKKLDKQKRDQLQSIAREVGLTPGSKNKKELVEFILKEGDRKKLYQVLKMGFEFKAIHGCLICATLATAFFIYTNFGSTPKLVKHY